MSSASGHCIFIEIHSPVNLNAGYNSEVEEIYSSIHCRENIRHVALDAIARSIGFIMLYMFFCSVVGQYRFLAREHLVSAGEDTDYSNCQRFLLTKSDAIIQYFDYHHYRYVLDNGKMCFKELE